MSEYKDEPDLRNELITEATEKVNDVFSEICKKLQTEGRRPITVDETDVVLDRIKHFTMEARVISWVGKVSEEQPSPQMFTKPKTDVYG